MKLPTIIFIDNHIAVSKQGGYREVTVNIEKVLKSWRYSLFSFEWLTSEGHIRDIKDLPDLERDKYQKIMDLIARHEPLERPLLGIGVMDNVEIGSRRDVFLTLAKYGFENIPVHIPTANLKEFTPYL